MSIQEKQYSCQWKEWFLVDIADWKVTIAAVLLHCKYNFVILQHAQISVFFSYELSIFFCKFL